GEAIFQHAGFLFSLYPRQGGHAPELDDLDNLYIMGKLLGRMHALGARQPFAVRPTLTIKNFGYDSVDFISEQMIPSDLKLAYDTLCVDLFKVMEQRLAEVGEVTHLRVHGDCHLGNILWRDEKPFLVDFDDARMAPAIQDIWMLLSGDHQRQTVQLAEIVEGYNEFHHFEPRELPLIEVLRTLRIMHYAAWLARRWSDPAFPFSFPWFNTAKYWEEHILTLREQYSALLEPPLQLFNA
ncbi:MAG: serine/threonine protein kinase, partial [Gammaproteobacteria bacterium]|nr:serine/threonine protein kinase [Gammaproteobacteria bacterium]